MAPEKLIHIIGCGPGGPAYLTAAAVAAAEQCDVLIGAERLHSLFPAFAGERLPFAMPVERTLARIEALAATRRVGVLVTGDPGVCSLARGVIARFGVARCRVVPGISALQLAFARLGHEWFGAKLLSAHATLPAVTAADLRGEERIAILGGQAEAHAWLAALAAELATTHCFYLCENVSLPAERVVALAPADWPALAADCGALRIFVALKQPNPEVL